MKKNILLTSLVAGVFLASVLLVLQLHQGTKKEVLSQFNKRQLMIAQLTAGQIESYFRGRSMDARYLSSLASLRGGDAGAAATGVHPYLGRLKEAHVKGVAVLDATGKVVYTTDEDAVGSEDLRSGILSWAGKPENGGKVRLAMENPGMRGTPGIGSESRPYSPRFFLAAPISRETAAGGPRGSGGKFAGVLLLTVDLEKMLAERIRLSAPMEKLRNVWIMEADGTLLLQSEHPDMVSKNFRRIGGECGRCHGSFDYLEKIAATRQGAVEYQVKGYPKKVAAFAPMVFGDSSWIVVVNAPYDEVTGFIGRNFMDTVGLLGVVLLVPGFAAFHSYRNYRERIVLDGEARHFAERKRVEEALRSSEENYRLVVENANDIIVVVQEGMITFANPRFSEVTGIPAEEIVGRPFPDFVHPADRAMVVERHASRMRGERAGDHHEFRTLTKTGETLWMENSVVLTTWEGRDAALSFMRDITQQKRLEDQLVQSLKMEAVGRLAGGIAHDFNNILTGIIGYSELLKVRLPAGDPSHRVNEEVLKAAERASGLTRQLLAFGRKQILQPQVIGINSIAVEMESMLRRLIGENIEVVMMLNDGLWNVKADPGQIGQVLMNIVVNAKDAMPDGGTLTIETANVVLDEGYSRGHFPLRPGSYVMLAIGDTGAGMDEETASKIFEPFFTTKETGKGTGLGLATVYGIVKQSGGFIWVYSEPGKGSTFKVYLPRTEDREESPREEVSRVEDLHGEETILLVEDDEAIRNLAADILDEYGYEVLQAGDGEEALRVAGEHPGVIDLLLTDVVMPKMGGVELYKRLRQLRPEVDILYMSGYTDDMIVHQGVLDAGVAFLQKPYTPISLARKVREVFGKE